MPSWIEGQGINNLWRELLYEVDLHGSWRQPRGLACVGVGPIGITLRDARCRVLDNEVRCASKSFMAGELTWILSGSKLLEPIAYYNAGMRKYSDDGLTLAGAYGPRVAQQLPYVISKLKADPMSRQAVITLWQPNPGPSLDIPCTISLQFRQVDGKLELTTFMRSNDLWLGFPYDVFTFTCLQEVVAKAVSMGLGPYHHVVGDLHLYEWHAGLSLKAMDTQGYAEGPPPLETSNLEEVQKQLVIFDSYVRTQLTTLPELSQDPWIAWMQQQMLERRNYHANKARAVAGDQGGGGAEAPASLPEPGEGGPSL